MKWDPKKKNIRKEGKNWPFLEDTMKKIFHDMQDNLLKKKTTKRVQQSSQLKIKKKKKTITPLLSFNSQLENIFQRKFTHNSHKNCKTYPAWNLTGSVEDLYKEHYYWIFKIQLRKIWWMGNIPN